MPDFPHRCVILIPAHNRRDVTAEAVRRLLADNVLAWATVLVIDDGSTDGTTATVRQLAPLVHILHGDGTWWWAGAIRRGMEWALVSGADTIIWLNDDCLPPPAALRTLHDRVRETGRVMWIDAHAPGGWNYGGHMKTAWGIRRCSAAEEQLGRIHTFSGNCVCLPRSAIDRVGLPHDQLLPHGLADLDYGLRLHAAGIGLNPLTGVVAHNADPHPSTAESWLASSRSPREIWRDFSSPRSVLHFPVWRRFALRHWGPVWGWIVFGAPYARWAGIAIVRTVAPALARRLGRRRTLNLPSAPRANRD